MEEILHRPEKSSNLNVYNILKCQGKYFSQLFQECICQYVVYLPFIASRMTIEHI